MGRERMNAAAKHRAANAKEERKSGSGSKERGGITVI